MATDAETLGGYVCKHSREELAVAANSRWGTKVISYFIRSYPTQLIHARTDAVFATAFANWEAVCDLRFIKASGADEANIVVDTGRGSRAGVDGPLNILAWCQLPPGSSFNGQLQMMLDGDEQWTDDPNSTGIQMLNVVAHELGHGLGLSHTNVPRQLLNPVYSVKIATPQSHDIADVVSRYGEPTGQPTPPPIPVPVPTPGGSLVLCKVQIGNQVYGGALSLLTSAKVELGE